MKRLLAVLAVVAVTGCAGVPKPGVKKTTPPPKTQESLAEEIRARISRRVLKGIEGGGRLAQVRKAGILRVALPEGEPPFQARDAEHNTILYGFNVDLSEEIAGALLVKANLELLDSERIRMAAEECRKGKYDLVFLPGEMKQPESGNALPYFYTGTGWRRMCAAGPDDTLRKAVANVLGYLNESGGYMQMYRTHFGEKAAGGR